jgi:hypothetical protein
MSSNFIVKLIKYFNMSFPEERILFRVNRINKVVQSEFLLNQKEELRKLSYCLTESKKNGVPDEIMESKQNNESKKRICWVFNK